VASTINGATPALVDRAAEAADGMILAPRRASTCDEVQSPPLRPD